MSDPSADRDRRLDEAVAAFLRAEQAGGPLDPAAWLAAHPDLRPDLDRFLADRSAVRSAVAGARTPPPAGFAPGAAFDGLRIVREVGRGGMGRVYEAVQVGLDRPVAVKTVRAVGPADAYRLLFADEVRALGRLKHPGIVPVYGCGERGGWPYLVMGLMAGSLADRLAAGPLPPTEAAEIVAAVARAVGHAHERGFLHRDIKPSNVLLDDGGAPHLADFGLVARLGELDRTGRAGTAGYMAPEQFAGSAVAVGERADVYGLGAVLYAALTAHPPLPAGTTAWAEPPPPRQVHPAADRRLEAVCLKCLAQDPAARYPTAAALADELDRFVRPPSRRAALAAGGAAVLAAAGGMAFWVAPERSARAAERYHRLMAEVRERVQDRPLGWTWANRDSLAEAAGLDTGDREPVELRTELARTFTHPDIREVGMIASGRKGEVAAFRPGTHGNEIALGLCLRDRVADPAAPVRVVLFDRPSGQVTRTIDLPFAPEWERRRNRTDGVRGLAFTPDGRWLLAGTRGGGVYAVDAVNPDCRPQALAQDTEPVKQLFAEPSGRAAVSVSLDGRVRRYTLTGRGWAAVAEADFASAYPSVGWEPTACVVPDTGDVVVCVPRGGTPVTTRVYRYTRDLTPLGDSRLPLLVRHPAPHPTAPLLLADYVETQNALTIDQLTADAHPPLQLRLDSLLPQYTEQVAFSPDGRLLVTTCDDLRGVVKIWDTATLRLLHEVPCPNGSGRVAFAADAPVLAVLAEDHAHLIEWNDGGPEATIGWHASPVEAVGLSAGGTTVRTVVGDTIHSWDAADGRWRGRRADRPLLFAEGQPRSLPPVGPDGYAVSCRMAAVFAFADSLLPRRLNTSAPVSLWHADPDGRYWECVGHRVRQFTPAGRDARPHRFPEPAQVGGELEFADRPLVLAARGPRAVVSGVERASAIDGAGRLTVRQEAPIVGPSWTAAAFASDGEVVVVGDADGRLGLARWPDPRPRSYRRVHRGGVVAVTCPAPGLVASGGDDGVVALLLIDGDTLTPLASIPHDRPVVALAGRGRQLAVVCRGERSTRLMRWDRLVGAWAAVGVPVAGVDWCDEPPPAVPWPAVEVSRESAGPGLLRSVFRGPHWEVMWGGGSVDPSLSHVWHGPDAPCPIPLARTFAVEWRGWLTPRSAGRYRFRVSADDAAAVYLGDRQVVSVVTRMGMDEFVTGEAELAAEPYRFRVEFDNVSGPAHIRVEWSKPGPDGFDWRAIDPQYLSPHPPK